MIENMWHNIWNPSLILQFVGCYVTICFRKESHIGTSYVYY